MERKDIITCAGYLAEEEKYSITVYKDVKGNISFMNTGVPENCWNEDISNLIGVMSYKNGETYYLDLLKDPDTYTFKDREVWEDYVTQIQLDVAKREYEKRSKIGSRFKWPENIEKNQLGDFYRKCLVQF